MDTIEASDSVVAHYDALSRWGKELDEANRMRIRLTLDLVPADVSTILDVGCGDGTISNPLVARGLDVTGLDVSREALSYFAGKSLVASLDRLPLPDRSFDLVICAEVLEHLPTVAYERALKEIGRVAGRYIIITTPNQEYLPAGLARCERCGNAYHINLHVRAFDRAAHRMLFQEFELAETVGIGRWRHFPFLVSLEQRLLGVYRFREDAICPHCGNQATQKPKRGAVRMVLLKGLRLWQRSLPGRSKARWIASLYQRHHSRLTG